MTKPATAPLTRPDADPTARALRDALGTFATGVAIAATFDAGQRPTGLTINSFASVSLSPPLVLWSIDHGASAYGDFSTCKGFSINILHASQRDLAIQFASSTGDRFAPGTWRGLDGRAGDCTSPVLEGAIGVFDCTLAARHPSGDHDILVGQVTGFSSAPGPALGYHRGGFVTLDG